VRFAGHVDQPTVAGSSAVRAVVAIPSRFEGYSLVCRERCGPARRSWRARSPPFRPSLRHGETGVLVPVGDVAALAAAIATLAADPERARVLGDAPGKRSGAFPDWEEVTDRVLAEYARGLL